MKNIYEIRDTTSDEVYWTLGYFATLKTAKEELLKCAEDKEDYVSEWHEDEDNEKIEIIEHVIGWCKASNTKFILKREKYYNEKDDEYYWKETSRKDL